MGGARASPAPPGYATVCLKDLLLISQTCILVTIFNFTIPEAVCIYMVETSFL